MSLKYETEEINESEKSEKTEEETQDEAQQVQSVKPVFPYYSAILIVCLIAVYGFQVMADGTNTLVFGGEKSATIAGFWKLVFYRGEYWRILTGASLHGGLVHLAFNCYALYVLGKLIETLSNRAHLAIIFLLSVIGGGVLSLIFMPDGTSVGASGGIVGFLGYLAVYGYRRREILYPGFLKNMLINIAFMAVIGIFVVPRIDNFAHLGGLLTGAIYGFIQISGNVYEDPRKIGKAAEIAGLAALGTFIAVCGFSILLLTRVF